MRKDYLVYGVIMVLLATLFAWIAYPNWADAVWWYTNFGNWGNNYIWWAGLLFDTALSVIFYVGAGVLLWKGIRDLGYCP